MQMRRAAALWALAVTVAAGGAGATDLRGHGGPVGALAVAGGQVLSGSFDTRAILWDTAAGTAARVLRLHEGSVTAVIALPDGRFATGGQDGRVALWGPEGAEPLFVAAPHLGPVAALTLSPDAAVLAAASWDGQVQLLTLAGPASERFAAHDGMVTGAAFLPDGRLATIGTDLRLRIWEGARQVGLAEVPAPPGALAPFGGGVAAVFADGSLRAFGPDGSPRGERHLTDRPLVALGADGGRIAAAGVEGTVWVLDADLEVRASVSPGRGPVWSVAFAGDALLTGGADGLIRSWDAATGAPLGEGETAAAELWDDGSQGARVFRACAMCHALTPEGGERAGPSLHGIFGRRIGTLPGYDYSDALRAMDIVWTPETVAQLFTEGPEVYTPGSRMPDQRVADPADRAALMDFLARATE